MASLQSYLLRPVINMVAHQMDRTADVSKLRAFVGFGSGRPRLPKGTILKPERIEGVPTEWLVPTRRQPRTIILYLHGGGWTLGWYNSHRWFVGHLCRMTQSQALAVDYRLAPEHPFPAALDDCVKIYRWLLKTGTHPHQIVIVGDSAGGNLTLTTLLALREAGDPLPAAAICISPMTDLAMTGETFYTKHDPMLRANLAAQLAGYYVGNNDPQNPLISPHYADLSGLPPLLIHVGADEILLSDATRLAENAKTAGVAVTLKVWPDMWHVWHLLVPYLPEAQAATGEISDFVKDHF